MKILTNYVCNRNSQFDSFYSTSATRPKPSKGEKGINEVEAAAAFHVMLLRDHVQTPNRRYSTLYIVFGSRQHEMVLGWMTQIATQIDDGATCQQRACAAYLSLSGSDLPSLGNASNTDKSLQHASSSVRCCDTQL